jgi:SUN domain-containing protein 1/2
MSSGSSKSTILLLLTISVGAGLFYVLEKLIGDLPMSYESRPGNSQPGLDGEAWDKVQKAIDGERSLFANRIDAVSQEMAMTRQRQSEMEGRMTNLASEAVTIKSLSDELRNKLAVLEAERQAAFSSAKQCEDQIEKCVSVDEMNEACSLENIKGDALSLKNILQEESGPLKQAVKDIIAQSQLKDEGCTTKEYIDAKWKEQMKKSTQDDVGIKDYALDDLGGMVVSGSPFTSPAYTPPGAMLSTAAKQRIGLGRSIGSANDAINKGRNKGDCFAFNGNAGNLTIRLSEPVVPSAVTVEHLNKVFSEKAGDSAPRSFKVFGYHDANELEAALSPLSNDDPNKHLLFTGVYDIDADNQIQTFNIQQSSNQPVAFVRLEVMSNHGNSDYTCLYRFRVHAE